MVEFFALPIDTLLERKFRAKSGESKWNTLWEAVAVLTAARLWLPQLGYGATVNLKSDNLATIQMVIKGKAKSAELNVIAREFALDLALLEYRIHWISHIFGATNIVADALSRLFAPIPMEIPDSVKGAKCTWALTQTSGRYRTLRTKLAVTWASVVVELLRRAVVLRPPFHVHAQILLAELCTLR